MFGLLIGVPLPGLIDNVINQIVSLSAAHQGWRAARFCCWL
jgi:hypothetical protein